MASLFKALKSVVSNKVSGTISDVKDTLKKEFVPDMSGLRNLPVVGGILDTVQAQKYQEQAEKEEADQEKRQYEVKRRRHAVSEQKQAFTGTATSYQTLIKTLETISTRVADAVAAAEDELKLSGLSLKEQGQIMRELKKQLKSDGEILKLKLTELASSNQLTSQNIASLVQETFPSMIEQMHDELTEHKKVVKEHLANRDKQSPVDSSAAAALAAGKEPATGAVPKTQLGMMARLIGTFQAGMNKLIGPITRVFGSRATSAMATAASTAVASPAAAAGGTSMLARAAGALGTGSMIGAGALGIGAMMMPRWMKGVTTGIMEGTMRGFGIPGAKGATDAVESFLEIGETIKAGISSLIEIMTDIKNMLRPIFDWIADKLGLKPKVSQGPSTTASNKILDDAEKKMDLTKPGGANHPDNVAITEQAVKDAVKNAPRNQGKTESGLKGRLYDEQLRTARAEVNRIVEPANGSTDSKVLNEVKAKLEQWIQAHGGLGDPTKEARARPLGHVAEGDLANINKKLGVAEPVEKPSVSSDKPRHTVSGTITPAGQDRDLGWLSRQMEGGKAGVGSVGHMDADVRAYGEHQISAKAGTMSKYMQQEGKEFTTLSGLDPLSLEFENEYKRLAANPETADRLKQTQRDFMTRTHYTRVKQAAEKLGFDVKNPQIQEALYSTAVQTSGDGNDKILENAAKILGKETSIEAQIKALYAARTKYVENLRDHSPKEATRKSMAQVLQSGRYEKEERILLQAATQQQNKVAPGRGATVQGTNPENVQLLPNSVVSPPSKLQGESGTPAPARAPSIMFQQGGSGQGSSQLMPVPAGSGTRPGSPPSPIAPREGMDYRLNFHGASPVYR